MNKKDLFKKLILRAFRVFPVRNNIIFCHNFFGRGYDENPRAIVEELLPMNRFKVYWALDRNHANEKLPDGVEPVIIGTPKFYYIVAISKIWIGNIRLPEFFIKRKKQYYIQTWHGDLCFKKIEYDALDRLSASYKRRMKNDNQMIDLMVSGSNFFTDLCRNAFKYRGEILQCGAPKNDNILLKSHDAEKAEFKTKLNIKEDNTILYMPTFREDYSHNPYDIDLDNIKKALEKRTHITWKVICKMHPNVPENNKKINCSDYISIDNYNNTQQAIIACDILVTDYSSVAFDALLADRVVLSYASDEKIYINNERGLYFTLSELPFPYFNNSKSIIDFILRGDLWAATKKYDQFIKQQNINMAGNASKTIADVIRSVTH